MAHFKGQVAGAVRDAAHGRELARAGVQRILNPFEVVADHAAQGLAAELSTREPPP